MIFWNELDSNIGKLKFLVREVNNDDFHLQDRKGISGKAVEKKVGKRRKKRMKDKKIKRNYLKANYKYSF